MTDTDDLFAAASDAIDAAHATRRPAFRGRKEIAEREAARFDQIDHLKRSVVDKDRDPLIPARGIPAATCSMGSTPG